MDLFDHALDRDDAGKPLPERLRPRRLEEFVGQEHVLGPGSALRRAIEADQVPSLILWGPPGTGKTTLGAHRGRAHRRHLRPLLRRAGRGEGDPRDRRGGPRAAPPAPAADHPLRRRDPPLHPVPAGRLPAPRRGRDRHAGGGHHREPLLRDQRGAPLPLPGGDAAGPHRRGGGRAARPGGGLPARARRDRPALRRGPRVALPLGLRRRAPGAGGARVGRRRGAPDRPGGDLRRRRRGGDAAQAAALRQGRRAALRPRQRLHQVDARLAIRTRPSTTWSACWRGARSRASWCGAW